MDSDITTVVADPKRPYKAYGATILAFLTIVVSAWIADDGGVTGQDILDWVISGLIGSGLTGATTYAIKNPKVPTV